MYRLPSGVRQSPTGVQSQKPTFLLPKGRSARGFSRKNRPFCYRRVGQPGVQSQNRAFLLPKGRSARGFSRKNRPFCYRRVGAPGVRSQKPAFLLPKGGVAGGSVANSGLFATEGWVCQGVRSQKLAFLLPKGRVQTRRQGLIGSAAAIYALRRRGLRHHRRAMARRGGYGRAVGSSGLK